MSVGNEMPYFFKGGILMKNHMIHIRQFELSDQEKVIALWRKVGIIRVTNDPENDIEKKLEHSPELFLVAEVDGSIAGSVMIGYEGHRGWIYYLGVLPELQRTKIGTALMIKAEEILREHQCPKINLLVKKSNKQVIDFYKKIGFLEDEVICMGKRLVYTN
jgi:ribosomal protein S18 acetylase RimI-like enzyme